MKRSFIIAMVLAAGLSASSGAWAQKPTEPPARDEKPPPREQPKVSLKPIGEVIAQIARQTPGRSLDSQTVTQPGGAVVYQIQWMTTDNRRITIVVDAQSGRILSQGR